MNTEWADHRYSFIIIFFKIFRFLSYYDKGRNMTHWGYYWKIKNSDHVAKSLCDWSNTIDSFRMFNKNNQPIVQMIKDSDRTSITIPAYKLIAKLQDDNSLTVTYDGGSYVIPVEKKTPNYGGYYYFFHCPQCAKRMRKLYCIQGKYLCRKCGNLGYYTQRLRPTERNLHMMFRIERYIKNKGGSVALGSYIDRRPLWMKQRRVKRLTNRLRKYDTKYSDALRTELLSWYPSKRADILMLVE